MAWVAKCPVIGLRFARRGEGTELCGVLVGAWYRAMGLVGSKAI